MCDSLRPHLIIAHQAPLSMNSPGNSTGEGYHFLLQGIFPTQRSNPGVPHCSLHSGDLIIHKFLNCRKTQEQFLNIPQSFWCQVFKTQESRIWSLMAALSYWWVCSVMWSRNFSTWVSAFLVPLKQLYRKISFNRHLSIKVTFWTLQTYLQIESGSLPWNGYFPQSLLLFEETDYQLYWTAQAWANDSSYLWLQRHFKTFLIMIKWHKT